MWFLSTHESVVCTSTFVTVDTTAMSSPFLSEGECWSSLYKGNRKRNENEVKCVYIHKTKVPLVQFYPNNKTRPSPIDLALRRSNFLSLFKPFLQRGMHCHPPKWPRKMTTCIHHHTTPYHIPCGWLPLDKCQHNNVNILFYTHCILQSILFYSTTQSKTVLVVFVKWMSNLSWTD